MPSPRRLALVALLAGVLWALTPPLARLLTPPDPAARTFAAVEGALRQAYADAQAEAARLATDPRVHATLEGIPEARSALLDAFSQTSHAAPLSAEVWSDSSLMAWYGPQITGTPDGRLVRDGDIRDVLQVVQPVRASDGVRRGEVRVAVLLRQEVPVRNAYLRPYDLVHTVARRAGGGAHLTGPGLPGRMVRARDGTPLARVVLDPPRPVLATRVADVQAFWLVLAGMLATVIAWAPYRRARQSGRRRTAAFGLGVLAVAGLRALLLVLDVPGRWQTGRAPLAPLFDPERYALVLFGGAARSLGDLLVTVAGALVVGGVAAALAGGLTRRSAAPRSPLTTAQALGRAGVVAFGTAAITGLGCLLAALAAHSVLDSTLDVFARTGLWPPRYVALLLAALLGATLALLLVGAAIAAAVRRGLERLGGDRVAPVLTAATAAGTLAVLGLVWPSSGLALPFVAAAAVLGGGFARRLVLRRLRARWTLGVALGLAALLYPLLWTGAQAQQRARMEDEAASFDESRDPRALFALTDVLNQAQSDPQLRALLAAPADSARRAALEARAADLVRGSLLGSLGTYDVSLVVFAGDSLAARFAEGATPPSDAFDHDDLGLLRAIRNEQADATGPTVETMTGRLEADRFQYLGLVPLGRLGYATARAEPTRREADTPFPRVLLPAGATAGLPAQLSVALFRDGVIAREVGREYGRYRLDPAVDARLRSSPVLWRTETVQGAPYRTRYERFAQDPARLPEGTRVVAVRAPALTVFDHLFFGLRLVLVGLTLAVPVYAGARLLRGRGNGAHQPSQRFQDRVLDAFLTVGGVGIVLVALVGVRVVTGENARSTEAWLDNRLETLEEALTRAAAPGEPAYAVLERTNADSLARAAGLDLHIFRGDTLVATSRPALVRDRLVDTRLPPGVARALVLGGERFVSAPATLGTFRYAVGYRALTDETGAPRYVLAVPTLAEQERLEEEQARVLAYLFGALLLLVLVVAATAAVLARALARPVARLREGLEAVGRGRFDEPIEVASRDEIGALARTFNTMQGQLSESRRQLAQQERQLAWREMARQVAHEIKNPLTPMRLSIQHLRRAYTELDPDEGRPAPRFDRLFERITITLLEQIEALTRIASDFSTFARLPRRVAEPLDLSRVVEEAAGLMQEEEGADVTLMLARTPLVVEADREELRRVFINLVKNALQAMEGQAERRVVVRTWEEGTEACASVQDHGTGIPEALRPRIFEPNFSTKTSGTGLGLAIARKAVEESGGTIGFSTEEGAGTTFTLRLPLVDA